MKPLYVVDEFGSFVSKTSTALLAQLQTIDSNIQGVHYLYGHPKEIIQRLAEKKGEFRFQKYPLVALFQDFKEITGKEKGIKCEVKLNLIICHQTDQKYTSDERYVKNFKPILYPIYHELLLQIRKSGRVMIASENQIDHIKIDRVFWGKEGLGGVKENVFDDLLDAIEIKDLSLKFYDPKFHNSCLPSNIIM